MEERTRLQRRQSSSADPTSIFASNRVEQDANQSSEIERSSFVPKWGHDFSQVSVLPMQAKLTVSQPNDRYEQEADRVADEVPKHNAVLSSQPVESITFSCIL